MKILIVNTSERTGGAAIAANRLMNALRQEGAEVEMLTRQARWPFYWERMRIFMANGWSQRGLWQVDFANCGEDITRSQAFREAEVVHLHWVNQGFLSLRSLDRIFQSGKRIVWTMHDQWPYTGVCHYAEDCERFHTHCQHCPQLAHPGANDFSYKVFRQKEDIWRRADITFVGCSQWIAQEARRSRLTQGHRIVSIPNPIDHSIFRPIPKDEARAQFGLPQEQKIVLFSCQKVTDERKGMRYLEQAMQQLPDVRVVSVGRGGDFQLHDEQSMAAMYAAADVFVTPSLQDNLPNTIVEAMSCGTPCVGFRVGGIPEMIHHLEDGYVARYRDADDLALGIRYALDHPTLSEAAIRYARETYNEHRVAQLYLQEYLRAPKAFKAPKAPKAFKPQIP